MLRLKNNISFFKKIFIFLLLFLITFLIIEVYFLIKNKLYLNPIDNSNIVKESIINSHYTPYSNILLSHYPDFQVNYITDDLGYIGNRIYSDTEILSFGNSFAFGYGVRQDSSIANLIRSYNAGIFGATFNVHRDVFQRVTNEKNFTKAVWFIYPPHLITAGKVGWKTVYNVEKDNIIVYKVINLYNKLYLSDLLLKVFGVGFNRTDYYTREWSLYENTTTNCYSYEVFENSLLSVKNIAQSKGIELYFLIIPSKNEILIESNGTMPFFNMSKAFNANLAKNNIKRIILKNGFTESSIICVKDIFIKQDINPQSWTKYYFKNDSHINEEGSHLIADNLLSLIK